ncbi:hypothetical protein L1887_20461 [Cichorium endivia]|nr:hypothetical protein L1887_20461 [Cichorium endivia]
MELIVMPCRIVQLRSSTSFVTLWVERTVLAGVSSTPPKPPFSGGKEGGMWWASQVVVISAGGVSYLDEIEADVDNEKEALRRHAKMEGKEVLADADIGPRVDRKIGFVV